MIFFDNYAPKKLPPTGNFVCINAVPEGLKIKPVMENGAPVILDDATVLDWKRDHGRPWRVFASEMSDPPAPPAAIRTNSLVESVGKWLALIGSVVAAGQAGTTWLRGYWQAEAEKQKSTQELALAELKQKSELAQQYLKVILDKGTTPADKAVLYTALAKLDGHSLQKWAQEQYETYQQNLGSSVRCL